MVTTFNFYLILNYNKESYYMYIMKISTLLTLFIQSTVSMGHVPKKGSHQELTITSSLGVFEITNKEFLSGYDLRPRRKELPFSDLVDYHEKHNRLIKLCNSDYSLIEREIWAKEYLDEYETMGTNLLSGGLLDDWNYEL